MSNRMLALLCELNIEHKSKVSIDCALLMLTVGHRVSAVLYANYVEMSVGPSFLDKRDKKRNGFMMPLGCVTVKTREPCLHHVARLTLSLRRVISAYPRPVAVCLKDPPVPLFNRCMPGTPRCRDGRTTATADKRGASARLQRCASILSCDIFKCRYVAKLRIDSHSDLVPSVE